MCLLLITICVFMVFVGLFLSIHSSLGSLWDSPYRKDLMLLNVILIGINQEKSLRDCASRLSGVLSYEGGDGIGSLGLMSNNIVFDRKTT